MNGFPWRALLFASLAVNLLVVGAIAGAWGAGVRIEREAESGALVQRLPGPRGFLQALPPETRTIMRQHLAATWGESREKRQAAAQARREAFAVAAQEPYDAARVRAAFERLRAADQAAIGVFHDDLAEAFGNLTPAQRRDALAALRSAAPAARQAGVVPAQEEGSAPDALAPAERQDLQERRQERRERLRERREERLRRPPAERQP